MRPTSSFIAQASTAVAANHTRRSFASARQPPTSRTGTSVSGWKSCSAGRRTTGEAHQSSAGARRHPAAGAVLTGEQVEERRRRGERERLHDEQPGGADAERAEWSEHRDSRLDVIAEQRPQVDRVERLVEVPEQPDVLREDPVVEVRGPRLVAQQRERRHDECVRGRRTDDDEPHGTLGRRRRLGTRTVFRLVARRARMPSSCRHARLRLGEKPAERRCRDAEPQARAHDGAGDRVELGRAGRQRRHAPRTG